MKFLTATIFLISISYIESKKPKFDILNNPENIFDFANFFDESPRRVRRAFEKSENTLEQTDDLLTKPEKASGESSEEKKLKLELGQKYTREFRHLLAMDGIELEEEVVNQLNQSLVEIFTETIKETMSRHNSYNKHPRLMYQSDFHKGFAAFQILMRKRVAAWLSKINEGLPSILVHDQHKEIESPKGKKIYQGLIKHKAKALRRAIRSFINYNYQRMEYEFLNGVKFEKKIMKSATAPAAHSTELFG